MATASPYPGGSMWGILKNDRTWMKCVGGQDWFSSREIALEILPQVIDDTVTPTPKPTNNKTPSESAMKRWRSNRARMERARRASVRRARKYGSMY